MLVKSIVFVFVLSSWISFVPGLIQAKSSLNQQKIAFHYADDELTYKESMEVVGVLKQVNRLFAPYFHFRHHFGLMILHYDSNASYHPFGNTMVVPYQFITEGDPGPALFTGPEPLPKTFKKHPKYTRGIFVHEYGHAIFHYNFSLKDSAVFDAYRDVHMRGIPAGREYLNVLRLTHQLEAAKNEKEKRELTESYQRANVRYFRKNQIFSNYQNKFPEKKIAFDFARTIIKPYNELFADVVSVVWSNDGAIVRKALYYSGLEVSKKYSYKRDFTRRFKAKGFKDSSPHNLFAPVRSFLWRYYLNNPLYSRKKPQLVRQIFEVFKKEIRTRFNEAGEGRLPTDEQAQHLLRKYSPEQLNNRLIQSLLKHIPYHIPNQ